MKCRYALALLPIAMSGCTIGFQSALNQAPGVLGELEQAKVAIATAPLAGCAMLIQQDQMIMHSLETGMPAVPVNPAPSVQPIITVPAPSPSTGIPGTFPTGPVVTPK